MTLPKNNKPKKIAKRQTLKMQAKRKTTNKKAKEKHKLKRKINTKITIIVIILFGILLIVAAYAWFSTSLNARIRTFRMAVERNSGLTISLDGITYDYYVDITEENLIDNLARTYPNSLSQWATFGLTPVSSNGITNPNSQFFDIYMSEDGVIYSRNNRERGYIETKKSVENSPRRMNYYVAFDIFLRNETGSPVADNLYLERDSEFSINEEASEEMTGLNNSIRLGIVKIGSTDLNASVEEVQNLSCNNDCRSIIYEPNSRNHTALSIENAKKYGVNLINGNRFPTYAFNSEGGPIYLGNTVSGSPNMDLTYLTLQDTWTEEDLNQPLFTIPDGVTKARIYLWIEGQDIDSLETNSEGADLSISINFVKDTTGYDTFNE